MSLLTYEVYYQTETAEGSTQTEVNDWEFNLKHFFWMHSTSVTSAKLLHVSEVESWRFLMPHRSRCPPSATMAPGWSRLWPDSRSALIFSAACVRSARPTCWLWRPTQRAATSCRPSSPHPAIKEEAKSSRDWRYEGSPLQKLYLQCGAKTTHVLIEMFFWSLLYVNI